MLSYKLSNVYRHLKRFAIMQQADSFEGLVTFIRNETREFKMIISRDTLLEDDLGVTGEDAYYLIQNFSKKYKIDITNFIFSKYFNDEPIIIYSSEKEIYPFTVGDLEKAMLAGRLDEEIIKRQ